MDMVSWKLKHNYYSHYYLLSTQIFCASSINKTSLSVFVCVYIFLCVRPCQSRIKGFVKLTTQTFLEISLLVSLPLHDDKNKNYVPVHICFAPVLILTLSLQQHRAGALYLNEDRN